MNVRRLVWISLVLAGAANAENPDWLRQAIAKEGKLTRAHKIESPDGKLRAKVPAKLATPVALDDGDYSVHLDIGAAGPVECVIDPEGFDPAALLRETAKPTFALIEPVHGKIEARAIERIDAGAIGASPWLELEWMYRANPGDGARIGAVKQFAALKDGLGIYCVHIEVGYRETFRTAVHALVETLASKGAPPAPYYAEVATFTVNGTRIGFATSTLVRDADGDSKSEQRTAMLMPAGPDTLQASDVLHVFWMRPDATLINAAYVDITNGQIESNLALKPEEDGDWQVAGTFKGKEVSATWPASEAPATWLADARAVRARLGEESPVGATIRSMQWIAAAHPTRRTEATTTIREDLGKARFAAVQSAGGIDMNVVLEKQTGTPVSGTMAIGPASMTMERAHLEGSF